jgi:hypothetical protein
MKKLLLLLAVTALLAPAALAAEDGFTAMFNGKDLTGWDAKPGTWRVENGTLTCESTKDNPCTKCHYMVWKDGKPGDFEIRAEFRLSLHGNSGIQIRSTTGADWNVAGYQADLTGDGKIVGYVYHSGMGLVCARGENVTLAADGKKSVEKIGDAKELLKSFKQEEWNTYRVVCHGPVIELFINDVLMSRITDHNPKARRDGVIALQMHPGPPMKVQFRNLRIKELK